MQAPLQYFLQIDGITDPNSAGVPFESFSFEVDNNLNIGSQSTGAGAGKVTFNPFSITRKIDKASPVLFAAAVGGKVLKNATLSLLPAVQKGTAAAQTVVPIVYKLTEVFVTQISEIGNVHGGAPSEEVKFAFGAIEITVDGVSGGFSVTSGAAG